MSHLDDHDDDANECDCADRVPAEIEDFWVCQKCDAVWYPEEGEQ